MMKANKTKVFLKSIGWILGALWKLFLLALYGASKLTEGLAGMLAKITEKFIK